MPKQTNKKPKPPLLVTLTSKLDLQSRIRPSRPNFQSIVRSFDRSIDRSIDAWCESNSTAALDIAYCNTELQSLACSDVVITVDCSGVVKYPTFTVCDCEREGVNGAEERAGKAVCSCGGSWIELGHGEQD